MASRALTQWQAGTETVWGTAVTPTVRLMGVSKSAKMMPDNTTKVYDDDVRNGFQGGGLVGLEQVGASVDVPFMPSFEDLPYYFDNGLGQVSPTGTGPYVRNWVLPVGSVVAPRILTLIHGNSQTGGGVYGMPGALIKQLKFSVDTSGPAKCTASFIGKKIDPTVTMAALSDRAVTTIMAKPWLVYVDAWGGTIGTTQLAATVTKFDLTIDITRVVTRSVDAFDPDGWEQTGADVNLDLTLRMNASTKALVDAYVAQTAPIQRQIRLKQTNGSQIVQFDFAGTWIKNGNIYDDSDDILETTLSFKRTYNTSLANSFKAMVTNTVATLP